MNEQRVFILAKRKLVITWLIGYVLLLGLVLGSYQYTNYVFRQLCGLISNSDDVYKESPPPSSTGKNMAKEMDRLRNKYHCK